MPLSIQQGLQFDGLTHRISLPSFTMDTVEVECSIDPVQYVTSVFIDARSGLVNGWLNGIGNQGGGWQSLFVDDVQTSFSGSAIPNDNTKRKIKVVAPSAFTDDVTIMGSSASTQRVRGTVYSITCYLGGQVVAKYNLDEGQGTTAHDTSGNGNDGTITGATWSIKKATTVQPKVKPKKNYIDRSKLTDNAYVDYTTGNILANTSYAASDYVPVKPSTTYTASANRMLAFYDANKTYISGFQDSPYVSPKTFTTPYNAYYLRISLIKTDAAYSTYQLEEGSVATQFEPYTLVPDNKAAPVKAKKNVIPPFSDPSYSSYFGNASNISVSSDGLSITATAQDTTARLSISQYPISVTPGKTYTLSGIVTPNIGRIRLGRKGTNAGINSVWSTDYNVRSISFTAQDDQVLLSADNDGANNGAALVAGTFTISNVQLEEGTIATAFEPYKLVPDNKPAAR